MSQRRFRVRPATATVQTTRCAELRISALVVIEGRSLRVESTAAEANERLEIDATSFDDMVPHDRSRSGGDPSATSSSEPMGAAAALKTVVETARSVGLQADLQSALWTIADGMQAVVPYTLINLYRADHEARTLTPAFQTSGGGFAVAKRELTFGEGLTGRGALSGTPFLVNDADRDPRSAMDLLIPLGPTPVTRFHLIAVPLQAEGTLVGVAAIIRVDDRPFDADEFALAQLFVSQAAALMRNAELTLMQKERYLGGIRALVSAVDAKDVHARGHSERVSQLSHALAEEMALPTAMVDQIELAALLHDIGKIGIPDTILLKLGALDDAERAVMMGHTMLGAAILADSRSEALRELIPFVRHHHEWHDGRGYPDGLAGDEIPRGAAIIAVADAFVTMTTERPYRVGRSLEGALDELRQWSGTQFHPSVVLAAQQLAIDGRLARYAAPSTGQPSSGPTAPSLGLGLPTLATPSSLNGELESDVGRLGDLRALGMMIELASITSLIPELSEFLQRVATLLRRRLDYEDVMVLLSDREGETLMVAAQSGSLHLAALGDRLPLGDNPWTEVLRTAQLRALSDASALGTHLGAAIGSALIVPLTVEGETIGVIHVAAERPGAFTSGDTTVLQAIAGQIASSIYVAQVHDATKAAASTDGLTGLANHRAFYQALEAATRRQQPIGVLLFDVIGLKRVNDSAGHLAGDLLLQTVAKTIRGVVRPSDVVARYGGDEFAVILGGPMSHTIASSIGNRIAQALHDSVGELDLPRSTLRFGAAVLPDDGASPHELVLTADRRMYQMNVAYGLIGLGRAAHASLEAEIEASESRIAGARS